MRYNDVGFPFVYGNPCFIQGVYEDKDQRLMRLFSSLIVLTHEVYIAAQVIAERKPDGRDALFECKSKGLCVRLVELPAYIADADGQRFTRGSS